MLGENRGTVLRTKV